MIKPLIIAVFTPALLSACSEEAAAPIQDQEPPEEFLSGDVVSPEDIPEDIVQDDKTNLDLPTDFLPEEALPSDDRSVIPDEDEANELNADE